MTLRLSRARVINDVEFIVKNHRPSAIARSWSSAGALCRMERHSFGGADYGFHMEVLRVEVTGRGGWVLMIVDEFWEASETQTIHSSKWLKLLKGKQVDVLSWIDRNRDKEIDHGT